LTCLTGPQGCPKSDDECNRDITPIDPRMVSIYQHDCSLESSEDRCEHACNGQDDG
jgi:hypothetical protein